MDPAKTFNHLNPTPMRYTLSLAILLATASLGMAQTTADEQKAIQAQVDAFFTSWKRHDFSDMKNYIAKECDFINIVGMHWKGREEVQYAHQTLHEQTFKDIPLEKRAVTIRFIKPDLAIAHVLMHVMKTYTTPDGSKAGDNDALATFVFVKRNGVWMVEAVENVVVNEEAKPFNPITIRQKSKEQPIGRGQGIGE